MTVPDRPLGLPASTDLLDGDERVVETVCTLDCPDACSLAVTVRGERIVKVDASPVSGFTDGWICAKVGRHARRVHGPERVMTPLVRTGPKGAGEFREASWDEALALIAGRMQEAIATDGPASSVAYTYNSSSPEFERDSTTEALFAALGATRVSHTICAATVGEAWRRVFGTMASADPRDVVHSDHVVIWGANPTVSNTHFAPLVNDARKRGAKVVVVDPRRTAMAKRADLHLAVRPGTDVVLALAVADLWVRAGTIDEQFVAHHADGVDAFLAVAAEWPVERAADVCGLEVGDIERFAGEWAEAQRSMLRLGWGLERNANGGNACRAVLALPVLGGHFGHPGAGVIGSTRAPLPDPEQRWPSFARVERRALPMHQIGEWLAPGAGDPCRVLFVQGANPVVTCPDQSAVLAAFARDDVFTVVHDQVLTDTARYADVVLPATTAFEVDDVHTGYGSLAVHPVRRVIDPVGQSRSNDDTGLALARAMGLDWDAAPPPTVTAGVPEVASLQFVDTHPPGGRARLTDPDLGPPTYRPVEAPGGDDTRLRLISPANPRTINSVFGEFQSPAPEITLHPDDAESRGLTAGEDVRVGNELGSLVLTLRVSTDVRPGVATVAKGGWLSAHPDGRGVNVLTPTTADGLAGGACFNDALVEVAALSPEPHTARRDAEPPGW
jgi:anaerobic selenocysteine-containing dehydrogenase